MPRGVYPRKPTTGNVAVDRDSPDNVLHPVDGYPTACPPPLCPECLPDGWPEGAQQSVGCAHGMWIRRMPEADF